MAPGQGRDCGEHALAWQAGQFLRAIQHVARRPQLGADQQLRAAAGGVGRHLLQPPQIGRRVAQDDVHLRNADRNFVAHLISSRNNARSHSRTTAVTICDNSSSVVSTSRISGLPRKAHSRCNSPSARARSSAS